MIQPISSSFDCQELEVVGERGARVKNVISKLFGNLIKYLTNIVK